MPFKQLQKILTAFMDENPGYYVECRQISGQFREEAEVIMKKGDCFSVWALREDDIINIHKEFSSQVLDMVNYLLITLKQIVDEEQIKALERSTVQVIPIMEDL